MRCTKLLCTGSTNLASSRARGVLLNYASISFWAIGMEMRKTMTNVSGVVLFLLSSFATGQVSGFSSVDVASAGKSSQTIAVSAEPNDTSHVSRAPLPPELALEAYERRTALQDQQLQGYSDVTIIHAELPDMLESGHYELQRHFSAPDLLQFTPIHFEGDGFVKHNVILRMLKAEKDRLQTDEASSSAIVRFELQVLVCR